MNSCLILSKTAKKSIREGKLKPRIIKTEDGKPYSYIFLKKENPIFKERLQKNEESIIQENKKE